MRWTNVKLIYGREVRDQLRDRRTLFMVAVLPLLLYPLLGVTFVQMMQFMREHPTRVRLIGAEGLPDEPPLIDDDRFAADVCPPRDRKLLEITTEAPPDSSNKLDELAESARREIQAGRYDVLIYVPENFAARLTEMRESIEQRRSGARESNEASLDSSLPQPQLFVNTASDRSRIGGIRVERVLGKWRDAIVRQTLRASDLPETAIAPFEVSETDIAAPSTRGAVLWSKILPFIAFVWALTGAFYPAIDLCAGEKERGTLETLLCSPALRAEIVWGKLLTTMTFSMATSLLNLACLTTTGTLFVRQLLSGAGEMGRLQIGPPPILALGWLMLALVPLSALFSALSLAVASFARSSREGQYYLMPLLMICLPLMVLPLTTSMELDAGTSLIPLTGVTLLMRALFEGRYAEALAFAPPVVAVTSGCCWLAIRWAIDQFNNENVLFRESERWDLQSSLVRMVRQRGDTPSLGLAVFCGVLLVMARFFAPFVLGGVPASWNGFVWSTLVTQVGMIAGPPLLLTFFLTRQPAETLLLRRPSLSAVLGAATLALALHPVGFAASAIIRQLYPLQSEVLAELGSIDELLSQAPGAWAVVGLLAVLPAICEELAFRGFILSGLRHSGRPWLAIGVSSLFFGAVHSILQQSIATFFVGMVIGFLAVRTRSLFATITFHAVYNSAALLLSLNFREIMERNPGLGKVLAETPYGVEYQPTIAVLGAVLAGVLLLWFNQLPAPLLRDEILRKALDEAPPTSTPRP